MSNRIVCTRLCDNGDEFWVILGPQHSDAKPYLILVQRTRFSGAFYTDAELHCPDVEIDENIPEAGKRAYWNGSYTATVRARVTYKGRFYCYLLQDSIGWPWVQVSELRLVET